MVKKEELEKENKNDFLKDFFEKNPDIFIENELILGNPFSNENDQQKEDYSDMF